VPATRPYPEPTPSSLTTPSHFLKIHLNIILPSASGSPQWSLSIRFPHQNPIHPSPLPPYALYAPPISFFSILPPAQYAVRSTDHWALHYVIVFTSSITSFILFSIYSHGSPNFRTSARHVSREFLKGFDDISPVLFSPASPYYPFRCYTNAVSLCTFLLVLFGLLSTLVKGRFFLTTYQPWKTLFAYSFHTLSNPLTCPSDKHSPVWLSLLFSCNLQQLYRHCAYCESVSCLVSKVLPFMETDSLLLYLHEPATLQ